ncbi:MAG: hypothetical protein ACPIA7_09370, partial [Akkermansiaceae bacterium]
RVYRAHDLALPPILCSYHETSPRLSIVLKAPDEATTDILFKEVGAMKFPAFARHDAFGEKKRHM